MDYTLFTQTDLLLAFLLAFCVGFSSFFLVDWLFGQIPVLWQRFDLGRFWRREEEVLRQTGESATQVPPVPETEFDQAIGSFFSPQQFPARDFAAEAERLRESLQRRTDVTIGIPSGASSSLILGKTQLRLASLIEKMGDRDPSSQEVAEFGRFATGLLFSSETPSARQVKFLRRLLTMATFTLDEQELLVANLESHLLQAGQSAPAGASLSERIEHLEKTISPSQPEGDL